MMRKDRIIVASVWAAALLIVCAALAAPHVITPAPPRAPRVDGRAWRLSIVKRIVIADAQVGDQCNGGRRKLGTEFAGMTWYDERQIEVVGEQDPAELADTVVHELLHAKTGPKFMCREMTGHVAIGELATAFVELLRENPELLDYLRAALAQPKERP